MTMYQGQFGTLDALVSGYVAGSLPRPLHVLMDAHLELSPANRPIVAGLEGVAGDALEQLDPMELGDRDGALSAIFASTTSAETDPVKRCGTMPRALADFVGHSVDDIPWKTKMPGFREYDMEDVDGCHVSMFWIKPGRTVPSHTHEGMELSLIIDGAFRDERGRFGRGDISIADPSVDHRPVAERDVPCIGFAVTDAPLRLTGSLRQRLSDILAI
ncbi:transcriptional regulator [Roseitalea porphyridii]|uniref:Transcriptional regulator n=2 Tax=Roseitalea porphyridii TaxID=1852022 RepID=A0A4P6V6K2_9HYPH|nr:ChrR family anti-sigma-E factor [Roseitalea porphyridii]QBK32309.1 transcriptional regulator [Roseitalea porphyridii]